jgi:predicted amidohydrolase YtcJ
LLDDKKDLNRQDLDRASKKHPICLVHVSVHGAVVNSLALKELGFTKKTPDPPGGRIYRDGQGHPNGVLGESAFMGPLFFAIPSIYSKMRPSTIRRKVKMVLAARATIIIASLGPILSWIAYAATIRGAARSFSFRLYASSSTSG